MFKQQLEQYRKSVGRWKKPKKHFSSSLNATEGAESRRIALAEKRKMNREQRELFRPSKVERRVWKKKNAPSGMEALQDTLRAVERAAHGKEEKDIEFELSDDEEDCVDRSARQESLRAFKARFQKFEDNLTRNVRVHRKAQFIQESMAQAVGKKTASKLVKSRKNNILVVSIPFSAKSTRTTTTFYFKI